MKKILNSIFIVFLVLNYFSCTEDDSTPIASIASTPVVLSTGKEDVFLDSNYPNNLANTFLWETSDYGLNTEIKYDIEISKFSDFSKNVILASSTTESQRSKTLSVNQLNDLAIKAGLTPDSKEKLYVRVISYLGSQKSLKGTSSNIISLNVTPYERILPIRYFVGSATAPGWSNNNDNQPLFINKENEFEYNYTGFFKGGAGEQFKILEKLGAWQPQWGKGSSIGTLAGNPGTQASDPGEIDVESMGIYTFKVNFQTLKYEFKKLDKEVSLYNSIDLVGSAVTSASTLTKTAFDSHMWKGSVNLNAGSFKFRGNNDDSKTWSTASSQTGQGTASGASIPVLKSGSYTIWFSDLDGRYLLIRN